MIWFNYIENNSIRWFYRKGIYVYVKYLYIYLFVVIVDLS